MGICRMCVGSLGHSVGSTMRNDDSEATRARPARTLVVAFALLIALALSGCDEEFCIASNSDPGGALLQGLLCLGNRPPSLGESPTASFTVAPGTVDNGGAVVLDASASSDPDGRIVRYQWDVDGVPDASIDSSLSLNFELDARDQGSDPAADLHAGGRGVGPEQGHRTASDRRLGEDSPGTAGDHDPRQRLRAGRDLHVRAEPCRRGAERAVRRLFLVRCAEL